MAEFREEDIFAPDEEGRKYYGSVYIETDYDALPEAPDDGRYPRRGYYKDLAYKIVEVPKAPKLRHIIGPSAIMAGASLGSGETLFWPFLTSSVGPAIFWMFWIGVLTQWLINLEIERPTAATGEGLPKVFARVHPFWAWLLVIMGILANVWPGWGTGSAKMLCYLANISTDNWPVIAVVLMLVILAINLGGPVIYNMIEKVELALVVIALILIVIAVFATGSVHAVGSLWAESIRHFGFFSTHTKAGTEVSMLSLLGGLAYAGAGGTINCLQSLWIREKGYAMAAYQGRIENPIRTRPEEIEPVYPAGFVFDPSDDLQVARWKAWWRVINLEHFVTFVLPLIITTMITCAIAVSFVQRGLVPPPAKGAIDMWIDPQNGILPAMSSLGQAWIAWAIALVIWIALFTTQLAIVDVVVRFTSDALYDLWLRNKPGWHPGKVFLIILLVEVFGAIAIIAANVGKPWFLLVLGAGLNGYTMWYYNMFLTYYNTAKLPSYLQPAWWRILGMWWAILFFGFLSVVALEQSIFGIPAEKYFVIGSENPVGTVLWAIYVILFIFVAALSVKYKLNPIDRRAEKAE